MKRNNSSESKTKDGAQKIGKLRVGYGDVLYFVNEEFHFSGGKYCSLG